MAQKLTSVKKISTTTPKKANSYVCFRCGTSKVESYFYVSLSILNEKTKKIPYCKDCIVDFYTDMLNLHGSKLTALYETCSYLNLPFIKEIYSKVIDTEGFLISAYIATLNKNGSLSNNSIPTIFKDGHHIGETVEETNMLSMMNTDKIEFTDQDGVVKDDVIRLLGYDVFEGASEADQKFLYNDLINYLDEDTLDDNFKISVIIQIVTNNNQIRRIDNEIAWLDIKKDADSINTAITMKQKIVSANDKLAKENAISIKNRGDKAAGKSTLTYMLKQYRELDFDDAEVDYYDQQKAYGMRYSADISNKSLIEQLQMDDNDYIEIINTQRELVQEYSGKVIDLEEENRKLHKKLQELEVE